MIEYSAMKNPECHSILNCRDSSDRTASFRGQFRLVGDDFVEWRRAVKGICKTCCGDTVAIGIDIRTKPGRSRLESAVKCVDTRGMDEQLSFKSC